MPNKISRPTGGTGGATVIRARADRYQVSQYLSDCAGDDGSYLTHFRQRVLQDALAEATADYWRRRADSFEAARPRPGDYPGDATDAELAMLDAECAGIALACRRRATVAHLQGDLADADVISAALAAAEVA